MAKTGKLILILMLFSVIQLSAQINARLMAYPDVSDTHITFVYAGNVWLVDRNGGTAVKLSSPDGQEALPKFSPDGQEIVYSANYDGNVDLYKISIYGGVPERITYHGSTDRMLDWTPDGEKLLFASSRESGRQRFNQLFTIDKEGGLAEKLPLAYGEFGSFSDDGKMIAFTTRTRLYRTWKRYRGGMAAEVYVYNFDSGKSEKITDNEANNELPMFHGNKIFYLSDNTADKKFNIWVYDLTTKEHKQITEYSDTDVHFPSIGPDAIVYEAGGDLYLMDINTYTSKKVNITVVDDRYSAKTKYVDANDYLSTFTIAPDGNRVLVEARGEVLSLPKEKGSFRNLTLSSGSAERFPAWSPDGKTVAYWSDASGEYELVLQDYESGKAKTVTSTGKDYKYNIFWSPDSKHIVFINQAMEIYLFDVDSGSLKKIDQALWMYHGSLQSFSVRWSADSKWIAYSRGLETQNSAVFIYNIDSGKLTQATSGYYSDNNPVFDPDGKYLYLSTNREFSPLYGDMDNSFVYPNSTKLAFITLQKETESLFAPENNQVKIKEDAKEEDKEDKKENEEEKDEDSKEVKIDFENFEGRLVTLPVEAGNVGRLSAVSGKLIFVRFPNSGSSDEKSAIKYYDFGERKEETIINGTGSYELSADGSKMLVYSGGSLGVIDVKPGQEIKDAVPIKDVKLEINPKEEWNQIFTDAWRLERDMFYDKNLHGVDWKDLKDRYGKILEDASTRYDVDFLIGELIGELNASHAYKGGGDMEEPDRMNVGYLGINWEIEDEAFKIAEIIRGAEWDDEVRSPFDLPGVDVNKGDYILAVNGVKMDVDYEPYKYFQNLAGKTVELTINDKPDFDGAKKVTVETLTSESRLRHLNWIENNRKFVDEKTNGRAGYIYVRSTGVDGQNELVRQFRAQYTKDALVIDERFNSGGQIPDRFIELLNRKPLAFWAVRDGQTWQWPPQANFGPKVMLINGWSGSGGDAFPDYFRKSGLGKLVGERTWGGLIGITGAPSLIDGGSITVPTFRMYDPTGEWFKEGHGVDPDVYVEENPSEIAKGNDAQLSKAVEIILDELKTATSKPKHVPYEKR